MNWHRNIIGYWNDARGGGTILNLDWIICFLMFWAIELNGLMGIYSISTYWTKYNQEMALIKPIIFSLVHCDRLKPGSVVNLNSSKYLYYLALCSSVVSHKNYILLIEVTDSRKHAIYCECELYVVFMLRGSVVILMLYDYLSTNWEITVHGILLYEYTI